MRRPGTRLSTAGGVCRFRVALAVVVAISFSAGTGTARPATLPAGFQESVAFSGFTNPTAVRFAADGRVFVAEKSGLIKVFDSLSDMTPTTFANLSTNVYNFWDRGLLGLALHPNFPTTPYVYVLYTYDHELGSSAPAPRWGTPGVLSDPCPTPPGPNADGCVVSGRLSRLTASGNVMTGSEKVLIEDWCQQYPSHSVGSLAFGADGALYVSGGDGASFTFTDYGQEGSPVNPCGDPPGGVGATLTPPDAEGGALRSQDLRTRADPVTLDGAILRLDPATGGPFPGNPLASNSDPNAQRIIAYGLRNPFRVAIRPGTSEVWIGDVGWSNWEEIDRVVNPADSVVDNFGWPCYEGNSRQAGYDGANLRLCENLYGEAGVVTGPYFAYHRNNRVVSGETCPTGSSSTAGLAFAFSTSGGPYPSSYDGALFFADYSRDCIWVMKKGANALPAPGLIETFAAGAANPVDLQVSPGGELFYVDFDGGTIRRIRYSATSVTSCPTGQYLAEYYNNKTLTGSPTFTRCETAIDYDWGTGGPGGGLATDNFSVRWTGRFGFPSDDYTFTARADDGVRLSVDGNLLIDAWKDQPATTYQANRSLTAGDHVVKVEYYENTGAAVAKVSWAVRNEVPKPTITAPSAGTTWKVGDVISFSGSATDAEDGPLPASALTWSVILHHCPSTCHTHTLQSFSGVASGSLVAPDHDYPSHLELTLTATDSRGATGRTSVRLDPKTVSLTFASSPSGLQLVVGGTSAKAPFTRTVIIGSRNSITAPSPQKLRGKSYVFTSWSDGGAQSHNITAGSANTTYTATFAQR